MNRQAHCTQAAVNRRKLKGTSVKNTLMKGQAHCMQAAVCGSNEEDTSV
jgi:hypothetical protein